MNIFKILASGHGNISETNISAYLGYLLNPNEDHGLKDEFLKRVLDLVFNSTDKLVPLFDEKIRSKNVTFKDLVNNKDYFIDVLLEKSVEGKISSDDPILKGLLKEKEKQIIDIIIVIYKNFDKEIFSNNHLNKISKRKSQQKTIIKSILPVAAILLENKIGVRPTPNQILKQTLYTHARINSEDELKSIKYWPI